MAQLLAGLDRLSRIELLCDLFSHCTHREQVEILERLPAFLQRDFLSLLPPELVVLILSYFDAKEIFKCMLVSRHWYDVITNCEPYWKSVLLRRVGITHHILKENHSNYHSMREFASVALKFQKHIRNAKPLFKSYQVLNDAGMTLTLRPAEPTQNGIFLGHEVHPGPTGREVGKYALSIRAVFPHDIITEVLSLVVSQQFIIMWSWSSHRYVVVYGSNGEWVRCKMEPREAPVDVIRCIDEIYSMAYYEIGCCPHCCLIAVIPKMPRDGSLWDVEIVKLISGRLEPEKATCAFYFLPHESLRGNVFLQAHNLVVIPVPDHGCDSHGFCCNHKVLLQFGAGFALCSLQIQDNSLIVETIRTYCPLNDPAYFASVSILGHKLAVSHDMQLVGYFLDGFVYTWNMETGEGRRLVNYRFPTKGDCIAIGHLFLLVRGSGLIRIISTITGQLLLLHRIKYTGDNTVYGPRKQDWLNRFQHTGGEHELAVTVQEWQTAGSISFHVPHVSL